MKDFSFQGKVYLGERLTGGLAGALRWVGDAPKCEVSLKTNSETRRESYSGQRLVSARLRTSNEAEISMTLNWATPENLAEGLYGAVATVAAGSVTNEAFPSGLAIGDQVALQHANVAALVITDSTGSPLTLTLNTDYTLDPDSKGMVTIKNLGAYVQPFKAAYTHGIRKAIPMFTVSPPERYLLLDGINTVDGTRVRVRLYRCQFDPSNSVPMINDSFGELEMSGAVLFDSEAQADAALGGFGRIEYPEAA